MNALRHLFTGLITALASSVLVISALSLSLTEGYSFALPTAQPTAVAPTNAPVTMGGPTGQSPTPARPSATPQPVMVTATAVLATACPAPQGWNPYIVQPGDTIYALAQQYHTSAGAIKQANCLISATLLPGTILYLPAIPATATATLYPTLTAIACGPPFGWVRYTIQPGDTLYGLSVRLNVSVPLLLSANCMTSSYLIAGQLLWVPYIPAPLPTQPAPPTQPVITETVPVETVIPTEVTPATEEPPTVEPPTVAPAPTEETPQPEPPVQISPPAPEGSVTP